MGSARSFTFFYELIYVCVNSVWKLYVNMHSWLFILNFIYLYIYLLQPGFSGGVGGGGGGVCVSE